MLSIILPSKLTGEVYLDFLQNSLLELVQEIPFYVQNSMWYICNGAPAHECGKVVQRLNESLERDVRWPAQDLNSLDFNFWGILKIYFSLKIVKIKVQHTNFLIKS